MKNVELVQFKSTDNLLLPGLLYEPKHQTRKVLIYLHGNGNSSIFYNPRWYEGVAKILNAKGITFFAFNNRGANVFRSLKKVEGNKIKSVKAGTAFELIKDCVKDIDGAVNFLRKLGYQVFYLAGTSTGANKICVYNYLKPENKFKKYVLIGGADDMGLVYQSLGRRKFIELLALCKRKVRHGKGKKFIPYDLINSLYSYQSFYDTINPDGYYNTFPFLEVIKKVKLSRKKYFREYKSLRKPVLVIYGADDEFSIGGARVNAELLKKESSNPGTTAISVIPNADHGFYDKEKELARVIANWL